MNELKSATECARRAQERLLLFALRNPEHPIPDPSKSGLEWAKWALIVYDPGEDEYEKAKRIIVDSKDDFLELSENLKDSV